MCPVDEEEAAVQGRLPDGQGLGVVGRGVPGPEPLHARKFHDDDAGTGWPVAFGYYRGSAANEVAAAMPGYRARRQFAITPALRLIQHLDFGDHVRGHVAMISKCLACLDVAVAHASGQVDAEANGRVGLGGRVDADVGVARRQ